MKRGLKFLAVAVFAALALGGAELRAAGFDNQRFEMLGKTGSIIWISEDVYEPTKRSRLHQIVVSDSNAVEGVAELENFSDWHPVRQVIERLKEEVSYELDKKRDYIGDKKLLIEITEPARDKEKFESFKRHVARGGGASSWNAKEGLDGIVRPVIRGRRVELVYYYPRGLYINYKIDRAVWFVDSGYLLIFTRQEDTVFEGRGVNGFILVRAVKSGASKRLSTKVK